MFQIKEQFTKRKKSIWHGCHNKICWSKGEKYET